MKPRVSGSEWTTTTQNQLNTYLTDDWRRKWASSTFTAHNQRNKYLQFFGYFFIETIRTHGRTTPLAMDGSSWQQQNTLTHSPAHNTHTHTREREKRKTKQRKGKNRHVRLFVTTPRLTMIHLASLGVWPPQRRLLPVHIHTRILYARTSRQWDKRRSAYPPGWIFPLFIYSSDRDNGYFHTHAEI